MDFRKKKFKHISAKISKWISAKIFKWISNSLRWARRALLMGPKGPTVAAEGCSPPQELEKATRRVAIFLVFLKGNFVKLNITISTLPLPKKY